jgi:hypothetical protein
MDRAIERLDRVIDKLIFNTYIVRMKLCIWTEKRFVRMAQWFSRRFDKVSKELGERMRKKYEGD